MCSVDQEKSVKSLKDHWIDQVRESAPDNVYCIVILNKYDLVTEMGLDEQKLLKYKEIEKRARKFATDNGYSFYTTSCLSGAHIHTALKELVDRIIRDEEIWQKLIPSSGPELVKIVGKKERNDQKLKDRCWCSII